LVAASKGVSSTSRGLISGLGAGFSATVQGRRLITGLSAGFAPTAQSRGSIIRRPDG
jgi:hypothetical protein